MTFSKQVNISIVVMSLHGVKNKDVVKVNKVATINGSCKNKKQQASPVCLTQTFPLLQSPPSIAGTEPKTPKHNCKLFGQMLI